MKAGRRELLVASVGVVVIALGTVFLLTPRKLGALDLPSPNGYDDFLAAAYMLRGKAVEYEIELALQEIVSTNGEAYALVSLGLTHDSLVPIRGDRNYPAAHRADLAR